MKNDKAKELYKKGAPTMAYPKPLSQKTIDKMFSSWDKQTVETLHIFFDAFANLYGVIQLKDAWKVFKKFNPRIHKKQFMDFSEIVRRENVPYYIFEIDELYSEERRIDTERIIVKRDIVGRNNIGKYYWVYEIFDMQQGKPYYDAPDLLDVATHPYYDKEILKYIDEMTFSKGENKGIKFSDTYILTYDEKLDLEYFKSETIRIKLLEREKIPFSQKFYECIIKHANGSEDTLKYAIMFLNDNGFEFESTDKAFEFTELLTEFNNHSHLWINCGHTPAQLSELYGNTMPKTISFGSNIKELFADGTLDKDEIIRQYNAMGIDVVDE